MPPGPWAAWHDTVDVFLQMLTSALQIGTVIEAPRHLQETTVRKERTYRAGQIVSGVVNDMVVESYAKRKYEELQSKRMHNGRGKGWQKRAKW